LQKKKGENNRRKEEERYLSPVERGKREGIVINERHASSVPEEEN